MDDSFLTLILYCIPSRMEKHQKGSLFRLDFLNSIFSFTSLTPYPMVCYTQINTILYGMEEGSRMKRYIKKDWLETALFSLGESSGNAPTIDQLTQKLGVTKGSFYHHFENYQDFQNQLLAFWEDIYTNNVVSLSYQAQSLEELLQDFLAALASTDPGPEIAIRAWAMRDAQVRAYVERVDAQRVAVAQGWFSQVIPAPQQAQFMAKLFNTLLVGCYSVSPPIIGEELVDFIQTFLRQIGIGQETN